MVIEDTLRPGAWGAPRRGVTTIAVRHHLPGRTRVVLSPWPGEDALGRLAGSAAGRGAAIAGASALTRSLLVEHPREWSAAEVCDLLTELLSHDARAAAEAADASSAANPGRSATLGVAAVCADLATGPHGLGTAEAERRFARFGPNAVPTPRSRSRANMLGGQFASLPVGLLVGSAVLSVATGGLLDALVTLGVVVANAAIGFASEDATERLIRRMSRPVDHEAVVVRDRAAQRRPASDLVPGDIVVLAPGAFVPADARLIEVHDLSVDESILTGESLPVEKTADALAIPPASVAGRLNVVHAGTVVTGGNARAVVIATGRQTELARTRQMIGAARPPRAALAKKLDRLATGLTLGAIGIAGIVLAVGLARREPAAVLVKTVIALAVSAIPEGLPAVSTAVLALGARAMEREGAFVRALPAVEAIGGVDTVCLDKTGTLTQNRMAVVAAATAGRLWRPGKGGTWEVQGDAELVALAEAVSLCNEASLSQGTGSSTETALLRFADAVGVDHHRMRELAPLTAARSRNHMRRWMATEHSRAGEAEVAVKGALDQLLALSAEEFTAESPRPLDEDRRREILAVNDGLARQGLRVLAVARRRGAMGDGEIGALVFVGMVALADPIRSEAAEAIDVLHRAGVRTVMITGDQPATALAVAEALRLSRTGVLKVVDGADIVGLDDRALGRLALATSVFARVSPGDKLRIVRALQGAGRSVAMIGDGVNDGPALRAAAVGVALGEGATDVAREVADIVVASDLTGLARAVARGRTAADNVRSAIRYLVSTNLSELVVMLTEALHGRGELETPLELLWLNLATDVMPALGLAVAEPRGDAMLRPPRSASAPMFDRDEAPGLGLDAAGLAAAALAVHFLVLGRAGRGPRVRTATFLTLALGQIAHGWVLRDRSTAGLRAARRISERRLEVALAAAAAVLALPFLAPGFGRVLGIGRPRPGDLAPSLAATALAIGVAEARHAHASRRRDRRAASAPASPPGRTR